MMKAKIASFIFLVVLMLPFLVSAASGDILSEAPKPQVELPESGECVRDLDEMRANHMNILKEARVKTVRDGIRDKDINLKNCFSCHKDKSKFCDRCHEYAGVQPGCFADSGGCHYAPTSKN